MTIGDLILTQPHHIQTLILWKSFLYSQLEDVRISHWPSGPSLIQCHRTCQVMNHHGPGWTGCTTSPGMNLRHMHQKPWDDHGNGQEFPGLLTPLWKLQWHHKGCDFAGFHLFNQIHCNRIDLRGIRGIQKPIHICRSLDSLWKIGNHIIQIFRRANQNVIFAQQQQIQSKFHWHLWHFIQNDTIP